MESIRTTFFQECDELLGELEAGLLDLQAGAGDAETVNAVFRAVHSIKGGAGAFALDDLVRFAHVFETTLDEVRAGRLAADADLVAVMLRSADLLSDLVAAAKDGAPVDVAAVETAMMQLRRCTASDSGEGAPDAPADDLGFDFAPLTLSLDAPAPAWRIVFTPGAEMYRKANDALRLLREMDRLGATEASVDAETVPALAALDPHQPVLTWTARLIPTEPGLTEADIRAVFEFVEGDCPLSVSPDVDETADLDQLMSRLMAESPSPAGPDPAPVAEAPPEPGAAAAKAPAQATIRVDLDRVDRLIDLVGELVINQAMLAQRVMEAGQARSGAIALGLDELEQLTREIQDSVMAIRAQPVKSVFQRMPRLVREVSAATGKPARLVTEGEATEVDKTVIERLADPITHMIRNALDHGLEAPEARLASGKPAEGVVRLSARHRSGRVVIEVSDDGGGIDRERVRSIAVSRGLIAADAVLTDEEADNLIFAPGFSTASEVSDISGRGVGMDVVKRSVQALGGRISIASRPGEGSTFTLSLPLTLAVLDGMVVTAGDHTLVAPISLIVETLRPAAADLRSLGPNGAVLAVRGGHVPLIDIAAALGWRRDDAETGADEGVVLLVESEMGDHVALRVDAIQGQRQVVIKSLEQNYAQVEGVAAATILGDGRVALILDVDGVVAAHRRARARPSAAPVAATFAMAS